jgi:hypothetical protein
VSLLIVYSSPCYHLSLTSACFAGGGDTVLLGSVMAGASQMIASPSSGRAAVKGLHSSHKFGGTDSIDMNLGSVNFVNTTSGGWERKGGGRRGRRQKRAVGGTQSPHQVLSWLGQHHEDTYKLTTVGD